MLLRLTAAAVVREADRGPLTNKSLSRRMASAWFALMPASESKGAPEAQNHVVFLKNFSTNCGAKCLVEK
jgi:hypothetical protein